MTNYTTKIKEICDVLKSINVMVDEDEIVQICLGGLAQRYVPIQIAICTRDKPSSFFELQSMLMVEENHVSGLKTTQPNSRMLYMEANWSVGVEDEVGQHAMVAVRQEQNQRHRDCANSNFGPSTSKGSPGNARNR